MGIYDRSNYGQGIYGPDLIATAYPGSKIVLPTVDFAYLLPQTNAQAKNYSDILLTWGTPDYTTFQTVSEFRVLSNPWGFPVDENDGTILLDITGAPPSIPTQILDSSGTPGKIQYYGIYMLTGTTWVRSGFAAELLPFNYENGQRLLQLMPEYFRSWGYAAAQVVQPPVQVMAPPIPVSGFPVTNPYGFDVRVTVDGTYTGLTVNGVPIGPTQSFVLLGGGTVILSYPFPIWISGNSYSVGDSVLSGGTAYVCTSAVVSVFEPATDPLHWEVLSNSPYQQWTAGQSYTGGQIVIYGDEYYLVNFTMPVSTVTPPTDTVNFTKIQVSPVTWDWQQIPPSDTNDFLAEYLNVLGYSVDILRTQYDFHFNGLNNPMKMSLGDLQNFCAEIGMPFTSELPAYIMRKAALFWTRVMLERGTLGGIAEHITLFSGYPVDLSLSRNILLEDDMSVPIDPVYPGWSENSVYAIGDKVLYPVAEDWNILATYPVGAIINYNGLLYQCILQSVGFPPTNTTYWDQSVLGPFTYEALKVVNTLPGPTPSGSPTLLDPTDTWQPVTGGSTGAPTPVTEVINIPPFITNAGLWEALEPNGTELLANIGVGYPNPLIWNTSGGSGTPVQAPQDAVHTFFGQNNTAAAVEMWLRTPARSEDDIIDDTGNHTIDQELVVQHGTPVPQTAVYSATTEYRVGDLVQYGNVFYVAQRGSVAALPPVLDAPLGVDPYLQSSGVVSLWVTQNSPVLTKVSSPALVGSSALHLSYTGTAAFVDAFDANLIPITPGAIYTVHAALNINGTGQLVSFGINFYDVFGSYISSSTSPNVTYTSAVYAPYSFTATAPINAAYAARTFGASNPASGSWTASFTVGDIFLICEETPEWAPLGRDNRLHLWSSAYTVSNLGINPSNSTPVTPFIEYYDDWGNFIARGFSRQSTGPSGGYPSGYAMDSFAVGVNWPFSTRHTDAGSLLWQIVTGSFSVTPDLGVSAQTANTTSIAVVPAPAEATQAVTFTNGPSPSRDQGVIFWYENSSNYWYAGRFGVYYAVSGTLYTAHTYTGGVEIEPGDRVYVWTNNTTAVLPIPGTTASITGPSVVVYKNSPWYPGSSVIVAFSASPASGQIAFPTSPAPFMPSTTPGTSSFSGIVEEITAP